MASASCNDGQAGVQAGMGANIVTDVKPKGQLTDAKIAGRDIRQEMTKTGLQGKPEQLLDLYNDISQYYDEYCMEVGKEGGAHNFARIVQNVQPDKTAWIVDVACGNGIVGTQLKQLGFTNIDGLDFSQRMLDLCEPKRIYNKLICASIEQGKNVSEVADGTYDVLCMNGGMASGHITPDCVPVLARMVKPGGSIVFNITLYWITNVAEFQEDAVGSKLQSFVDSGVLTKWSQSKHVYYEATGEQADFYILTVA